MIPFGDRAMRFAVPANAPRRRLAAELTALPGVRDVVLAEEVGCVVFGHDVTTDAERAAVAGVLAQQQSAREDEPGTPHVIPVIYDGEDLDEVARTIGRTSADVVALHSEAEYRVAMLGFLPGFAYLHGLPSELRLPRRAPRPRVPARSVAIAADYTGIYPFASPGGWHLLGRAPGFEAFGAGPAGAAALAIGDVVRFAPAPAEPSLPAPRQEPALPVPSGAHLEITRAAGFALLVDVGRPGRMHEGVPPGGPLVRSAFEHANALAGNEAGACALEITGTIEVTARGGSITLADDEGGAVTLADGERHVVSTAGRARVRYLALEGGIDAPVILGGRGALLVAGIGRLFRRGDRLAPLLRSGETRTAAPTATTQTSALTDEPIAIMEGPDAALLPRGALVTDDFRVSAASDRTGTRLEGHMSLPAPASAKSTPMVMGAIELTPSGLIVFGPDHPTTGGYPVVAVVRSASLDRLFSRPIGAAIRFTFA